MSFRRQGGAAKRRSQLAAPISRRFFGDQPGFAPQSAIADQSGAAFGRTCVSSMAAPQPDRRLRRRHSGRSLAFSTQMFEPQELQEEQRV